MTFGPNVVAKINVHVNRSNSLNNSYDSETVIIPKEDAFHPSYAFRNASEMILECQGLQEPFILIKSDGELDSNCTVPGVMAANLMLMIELNLEHLACIKNAGG